ncbi:autotransporter outer membrane beta-barrel domain-containing protein [Brucella sp. NF 2815]
MQFITTDYKLSGGTLTLVPTPGGSMAKPVIRVGDGGAGDSAITTTVSTVLAGTHGMEKANGGTLILTGVNTYTGGTAISGGTLQLGDGTTNGSVQGAISTGADAAHKGVLAIHAAAATPAIIDNTISGEGSVSVLGGTVTLSGANTYTGGTTLAGGTTIVTADANLGAAGSDVVLNNGATLRFGANLDAAHSFTHALQLGTVASDAGTLDTDGHDVAMSGVLSGAGDLTKSGAGTLTLLGANTYTGGTQLTGGTLAAGSDSNLGDVAGGLTFDGGTLQVTGTGWKRTNRAVRLEAGGGTFNIDDATIDFVVTQRVSGAGGLVQNGTGTLTLSADSSYTGSTTVTEGRLDLVASHTGGGTTTVHAGAELQIGNGFADARLVGDIVNNGALVVDRTGATALDGEISGTGDLTKLGAGTLTLSGANSYSGATTVTAGTLVVTGDKTGAGTTTIDLGASLQIGAGGADGSLAGDIVNNGRLVVDRTGVTDLADAISGAGDLLKNGAGTLLLSGANSYSGATTVTSGTLTLTGDKTGAGTTTVEAAAELHIGAGGADGSLAGDVVNNGRLVVDRTGELDLAGAISGLGDLTKTGAGTLTLSGANSYAGVTTVSAGRLVQGAADAFNAASSRYDVAFGGTLDLGGFDTTLAALYNAGTINMNVGVAGSTLTVNGDYVGNDGTIIFNTVLGDDNSNTDKLMVGGDTAGNTNVQVVNRGGLGAQTVNGIEIINVRGQSNGVFSLVSDYRTKDGQKAVVGGAYAYTLHQGPAQGANDGNWYLVSRFEDIKPDDMAAVVDDMATVVNVTPRYGANVPVYEAYSQILLGLNTVSSAQERRSNRVWAGNGNRVIVEGADPVGSPFATPEEAGTAIESNGVWGRIEGVHNRINAPLSTSGADYRQDIFKMEAGIDGLLTENESGQLITSALLHYVHGNSKVTSIFDAENGGGKISTDGYGFGSSLTWYGDNGFYLDAQGQATWYRSDLSYNGGDNALVNGNEGFGYVLSLETGKRLAINSAWSVTPQVQLNYSRIQFDDFYDSFGNAVSPGKETSLQGRLGLTLDHQTSWQNANGLMDRVRIYGLANLYYEFLGGTDVDVAGTSFANRKDRLWGGVALGGAYNWNNDKYSIYGEGVINTSLDQFADSYAIKGNVGFKVKW